MDVKWNHPLAYIYMSYLHTHTHNISLIIYQNRKKIDFHNHSEVKVKKSWLKADWMIISIIHFLSLSRSVVVKFMKMVTTEIKCEIYV